MPYANLVVRKSYSRAHYLKHKDARQAYSRRKYREDPEKRLAYSRQYKLAHLNRWLWSVAKHRAKRKGLEFSITPDDINIPECCPVFGFKLESGIGKTGRGGQKNSPSLDRIDPAKGYIPGNVRVISLLANTMKGAANTDELTQFARWVLT